mmetsp:Transcript_64114/g.202625  ORF Transcript_64114/g.202625 Transcript_64114/m.202625 type:complete len:392 (+) Transcript_64114:613-1788(+)
MAWGAGRPREARAPGRPRRVARRGPPCFEADRLGGDVGGAPGCGAARRSPVVRPCAALVGLSGRRVARRSLAVARRGQRLAPQPGGRAGLRRPGRRSGAGPAGHHRNQRLPHGGPGLLGRLRPALHVQPQLRRSRERGPQAHPARRHDRPLDRQGLRQGGGDPHSVLLLRCPASRQAGAVHLALGVLVRVLQMHLRELPPARQPCGPRGGRRHGRVEGAAEADVVGVGEPARARGPPRSSRRVRPKPPGPPLRTGRRRGKGRGRCEGRGRMGRRGGGLVPLPGAAAVQRGAVVPHGRGTQGRPEPGGRRPQVRRAGVDRRRPGSHGERRLQPPEEPEAALVRQEGGGPDPRRGRARPGGGGSGGGAGAPPARARLLGSIWRHGRGAGPGRG